MPAPPDDARSFSAEVTAVDPIGADGVLLRVRPEVTLRAIRASRFFMLRREDALSPAIPRPFSLYRQPPGELEFLIKVMGRGTAALARTAVGTAVRCIGPLGNGWPALDGDGPPWVLLAGGVGCAPFPLAIAQALSGMDGRRAAAPDQLTYLFGAATSGHLYELDHLRTWLGDLGVRFEVATDDGSEGLRGNVLGLLSALQAAGAVPPVVRLLACGPEPMLAAVSSFALGAGLEAWLSLETLMGCGVGICNGCPVPTAADGPHGDWPNLKCCVEGPVFRADAIRMSAVPAE